MWKQALRAAGLNGKTLAAVILAGALAAVLCNEPSASRQTPLFQPAINLYAPSPDDVSSRYYRGGAERAATASRRAERAADYTWVVRAPADGLESPLPRKHAPTVFLILFFAVLGLALPCLKLLKRLVTVARKVGKDTAATV